MLHKNWAITRVFQSSILSWITFNIFWNAKRIFHVLKCQNSSSPHVSTCVYYDTLIGWDILLYRGAVSNLRPTAINCTPSALSITPRVFHWDTDVEKYTFWCIQLCFSTIVMRVFLGLQFHIFLDAKRVFLGLQCMFFWAICQTCFSEIAMHVFSELYTILNNFQSIIF